MLHAATAASTVFIIISHPKSFLLRLRETNKTLLTVITVGVKVAKAQVVQQLGLVKLGRVGDGGGAGIIDWEFEQPANIEPNFYVKYMQYII